jgi:hypothetical protein
MGSHKKILMLKYFSRLKILTSLFYMQKLAELFFFLPLFFNTLFLSLFLTIFSFNAPSL